MRESASFHLASAWFTSLVSSDGNVKAVRGALRSAGAVEVRELPLSTRNKRSRVVAWTFQDRAMRSKRLAKAAAA